MQRLTVNISKLTSVNETVVLAYVFVDIIKDLVHLKSNDLSS